MTERLDDAILHYTYTFAIGMSSCTIDGAVRMGLHLENPFLGTNIEIFFAIRGQHVLIDAFHLFIPRPVYSSIEAIVGIIILHAASTDIYIIILITILYPSTMGIGATGIDIDYLSRLKRLPFPFVRSCCNGISGRGIAGISTADSLRETFSSLEYNIYALAF